jgi:tetratricopeptide (TPR) repeat protein
MSHATSKPDVAALLNAAATCYAQGRLQEAAGIYRQAAACVPRDLRPIYSLALIDIRLGDLPSARERLKSVIAIDPRHYAAYHNLGAVCQNLNEWQEAAEAYESAHRLDPAAAETHFALARTFAVLGRLQDASDCYRALCTCPDPSVSLRALIRLASLDPAAIDDRALSELKRGAGNPDAPGVAPATAAATAAVAASRIEAWFALAQVLERRGADSEAFAALTTGNRLKHASLTAAAGGPAATCPDIVEREHEGAAQFVIDRFDATFLSRASNRASASRAPIFVVGMPRCGSSLIEQILSSHSLVQSLGESAVLSAVLDRGFANAERSGDWRPLADDYLESMQRRGWKDSAHFVDKTLENHLRIGAIELMFPNALILDSVRNPVDTCLSCYRQLFTQGNETLYDLRQIGRAYVRYRRVMEHWDRVLPGRVIRVEHEKLVADPEREINHLVTQICKLQWEPACLRFHEAAGAVRTASAAQVRQPIFQTSIGRWSRFAKELEPLLQALGPYALTTACGT